MKDKEIILQTPNERMSDLATDIAFLVNLKNRDYLTKDEHTEILIKIGELEAEKKVIYENTT